MPVLLGFSYVLAGAAMGLGTPAALSADASGTGVGWVATGSYAWVLEIRPGQPLSPWPSSAPQPGFTIELPGDVTVDVADQLPADPQGTTALAVLFLLVAVAARRLGLPGWSVLLGLSSAAALGPLAPALGYPPTLLIGLLPPAVTVAAIGGSTPALARWRFLALALAVVAIVLAIPVAATVLPDAGWPWGLLWEIPAATVIGLGLLSALPLAVRTLGARGVTWPARFTLFVGEAFPMARSSRLAASAQERDRLAAELHDEVLPQISQALLELDARDPAARRHLAGVVDRIRQSMTARHSVALQAAGLAAAVAAFATSLDVPMDIDMEPHAVDRAPARVEAAAYRVAQLAIANAAQHSSAEKITIRVIEESDRLELQVADDGVGIDATAAENALARGHIGLAAMRSEAADVGARLDVRSTTDRGTTVEFTWQR